MILPNKFRLFWSLMMDNLEDRFVCISAAKKLSGRNRNCVCYFSDKFGCSELFDIGDYAIIRCFSHCQIWLKQASNLLNLLWSESCSASFIYNVFCVDSSTNLKLLVPCILKAMRPILSVESPRLYVLDPGFVCTWNKLKENIEYSYMYLNFLLYHSSLFLYFVIVLAVSGQSEFFSFLCKNFLQWFITLAWVREAILIGSSNMRFKCYR